MWIPFSTRAASGSTRATAGGHPFLAAHAVVDRNTHQRGYVSAALWGQCAAWRFNWRIATLGAGCAAAPHPPAGRVCSVGDGGARRILRSPRVGKWCVKHARICVCCPFCCCRSYLAPAGAGGVALDDTVFAARAALFSAAAAPYDLSVAQLGSFARNALTELVTTVPGIPAPGVAWDAGTSATAATALDGAAGADVLLVFDPEPASSRGTATPSAGLQSSRQGGSHGSRDLTLTALLLPQLQPADGLGGLGAAALPSGSSSAAALGLAAPDARAQAASVAAALAAARRGMAACECAFARLLAGAGATFVACDSLTRSSEMRSVTSGAGADGYCRLERTGTLRLSSVAFLGVL